MKQVDFTIKVGMYVTYIFIHIYMHVWSRLFLGTVFSVGKNGKLRWVDHGGGHEQRIHIIYIIYIYVNIEAEEKRKERKRERGREGGEAEKDTEEKLVLCIYVYTLYIYIYTSYILWFGWFWWKLCGKTHGFYMLLPVAFPGSFFHPIRWF